MAFGSHVRHAFWIACLALGARADAQSPSAPVAAAPPPAAPVAPPPPAKLPDPKPVDAPPAKLPDGKPADAPPAAAVGPGGRVLRDPLDRLLDVEKGVAPAGATGPSFTQYKYDLPNGYSGPSGILPRSGGNDEFETVEDRWRIGMPDWDRYDKKHPQVFDYPFRPSAGILDPFNLNVIKGDYPILGNHVFLNLTGMSTSTFLARDIPTATTPFESTARPNERDFFGRSGQFLYLQNLSLSMDLFRGDAAFKPVDWRIKMTPTLNVNTLSVQELAVVNPDVRKGTIRNRSFLALEEWFGEYKLADLSPEYDFLSVRVGSQPFTSDFRGFIFSDINRGIRFFGNLDGNRTQYNLAYFRQLEKDTNSQLNTFRDRNQNILIANIFQQDFIYPGYQVTASFHYNNDGPDRLYDKNNFLVRPDPVGIFQPHRVEAYYFGFGGDGHIGRYNVSHQFYWAVGRDSNNPLAGQAQSISAQMASLELSYDRDWARFRVSGLYQSGDGNINNGRATGFDGILDNQNFGGENSYWSRNRIPLFGVGLTNDKSNFANLRSSRIQGQSNFVNPGLFLVNTGFDVDVTPRFRIVNNANYLWFDKTNVLEAFVFQNRIDRDIGADLSSSFEYRPKLNNNIIVLGGLAGLIPGGGFRQLYNKQAPGVKVPTLLSAFFELTLLF